MLGFRSQASCHTEVYNPWKTKTISMIKAEQMLTGPFVVLSPMYCPGDGSNTTPLILSAHVKTVGRIHKLQIAKDVPSISITSNSGTCMVRKWHSPVCWSDSPQKQQDQHPSDVVRRKVLIACPTSIAAIGYIRGIEAWLWIMSNWYYNHLNFCLLPIKSRLAGPCSSR